MQRLEKLVSLVKPYYTGDDPAHDWAHIERVIATAKKLAAGEAVRLPCLLAAVYCHDLVNLPKDHPERSHASSMAAKKAEELLIECNFSQEEIKSIKQFIIEHSFSKGLAPTSLEASILQDSDRLDTLGAIGILRCASINTQMKAHFYDPSDPLAKSRSLDDKKYMIDHYFIKIFKLPEMMNTKKAKALALERVSFMRQFLDQLILEID